MHAFILAGGFATRLWPLTERRAKPLLPLAGKPMVSHIMEQIPSDIPVTVSTNAAFGKGFEDWKKEGGYDRVEILIEQSKSDDQKLGALGAVAQWVEMNGIDDDILLLTGDNYLGFSLHDFLAAYRPGVPLLAAFDIKDTEAAKSFGTVVVEDLPFSVSKKVNGATHKITAFEEKPANPRSTLVSTGCSILPKRNLKMLLEYAKEHPDNVGGIFEEMVARRCEVHCYTFSEPWFDVGSFQAYLEATKALVGESMLLGEGAQCEATTAEGSVVIGNKSIVKNSQLTNVVIFNNCSIDDCVLSDCIIDANCRLKGIDLTGKMLREGTTMVLR